MAKTVLLADDSATIRRVVELTFSDTDIRVVAVGNGTEALARLAELEPDLVLADVRMPEPSGYEICTRVKGSARPVPVLLLAGTFEPLDEAKAEACGADGHLVKPFDSRELVEQVQRLLRADALDSPADQEPSDEQEASPLPDPGGEAESVEPSLPGGIDLDTLARAVAERLSLDVVREIAREVVPELAERIVRERIRELEQERE